jgi:hypothetical protein
VQAESSSGTVVNGHSGANSSKATHVPVSHSRNSSDSSGYHEASVLSESPAEGNQIPEKYIYIYTICFIFGKFHQADFCLYILIFWYGA